MAKKYLNKITLILFMSFFLFPPFFCSTLLLGFFLESAMMYGGVPDFQSAVAPAEIREQICAKLGMK